jgi:hypothetical protein
MNYASGGQGLFSRTPSPWTRETSAKAFDYFHFKAFPPVPATRIYFYPATRNAQLAPSSLRPFPMTNDY